MSCLCHTYMLTLDRLIGLALDQMGIVDCTFMFTLGLVFVCHLKGQVLLVHSHLSLDTCAGDHGRRPEVYVPEEHVRRGVPRGTQAHGHPQGWQEPGGGVEESCEEPGQ